MRLVLLSRAGLAMARSKRSAINSKDERSMPTASLQKYEGAPKTDPGCDFIRNERRYSSQSDPSRVRSHINMWRGLDASLSGRPSAVQPYDARASLPVETIAGARRSQRATSCARIHSIKGISAGVGANSARVALSLRSMLPVPARCESRMSPRVCTCLSWASVEQRPFAQIYSNMYLAVVSSLTNAQPNREDACPRILDAVKIATSTGASCEESTTGP
mmetsp:Transcript_12906/g.39391  ORF Transcript_12906/g.39391 Transcript_12906/m.39391 type:complete len:219 (-) Transcript_12906:780-1436(-)|eukprot:scaffold120021_cov32-Tisochrysis_lutea.AAC.5